MEVYVAIDLHGNNNQMVVLGEDGKVKWEGRQRNKLDIVLRRLERWRGKVVGVVVESTFNWYWLVDGLMEAGYRVHLAATAAIRKYSGVKYADDRSDAEWLAQMLRLGILPEGYIYPRQERGLRDLLRKRMQLVRQRTANILALENQCARNEGGWPSANSIKKMTEEHLLAFGWKGEQVQAAQSNLRVMSCLDGEIRKIEKTILQMCAGRRDYQNLLTVPGVGKILALTICLEVGQIERFANAGHFASYCRCAPSVWVSNGKKKAEGNRRNGNSYLAWAFVEAAAFAIRFEEVVRRYYQRKAARSNKVVARKAVANKLARGCYHVMKKQEPYDVWRAFGGGR